MKTDVFKVKITADSSPVRVEVTFAGFVLVRGFSSEWDVVQVKYKSVSSDHQGDGFETIDQIDRGGDKGSPSPTTFLLPFPIVTWRLILKVQHPSEAQRSSASFSLSRVLFEVRGCALDQAGNPGQPWLNQSGDGGAAPLLVSEEIADTAGSILTLAAPSQGMVYKVGPRMSGSFLDLDEGCRGLNSSQLALPRTNSSVAQLAKWLQQADIPASKLALGKSLIQPMC